MSDKSNCKDLNKELNQQFLNDKLVTAAKVGDIHKVASCVAEGAELDHQDEEGWSALTRAVFHGQYKVTKKLLDCGAHVDNANNIYKYCNRETALIIASKKGQYKLVTLLLDRHAAVDLQNDKCESALMKAAEFGHEKVVELLLAKNATTDLKDEKGETALIKAKKNGHKRTIIILIKYGASIDFESSTITWYISVVDEGLFNWREDELHTFLGEDDNMFHLRKKEYNDDVSLVKFIVSQKLIQQREQLIDLLKKIDNKLNRDDIENCEYRIIEQIKRGISSSPDLDDCIKSVQQRFPWTNVKMVANTIKIIVVNICFGWGLFSLDFWTDIKFTLKMFENYGNFTINYQYCKRLDNNYFTNFDGEICSIIIKISSNQQRFENPEEFWNAGIVSAIHCALPILIAVFIWIVSELQYFSKTSIFKLPLPPLTKLYKTVCEIKLFKLSTVQHSLRNKSEENRLNKEFEKQANIVNASMIVEASCESGFQFWLQTNSLMPILIISFTELEIDASHKWTDLFNWRIFSIVSSFATFAWAFYNIRFALRAVISNNTIHSILI